MNSINTKLDINFKAKPFSQKEATIILRELSSKNVKSVDLFCHTSADEDTINSAKVFYNWLTSLGKNVRICVEKSETKQLYFDENKYKIKYDNKISDKAVLLDFNSKERITDSVAKILSKFSSQDIFGLDHHAKSQHTIGGSLYVDDSARACCAILSRFFDKLNIKLNNEDLQSLYCGIVSDYQKSGFLKVEKDSNKYIVKETKKLLEDKNALEVYQNINRSLNETKKQEILSRLDVLSRLSPDEKALQEKIFSNVQFSKNKDIAYVVIDPKDELWQRVGMDNRTTSAIMKDFRLRVLKNANDELLQPYNDDLKKVKTVIVFYRKNPETNEYRMSIHSKENKALEIIEKATKINPSITAGGHEDRAGGKIDSINLKDVQNFVNAMINQA